MLSNLSHATEHAPGELLQQALRPGRLRCVGLNDLMASLVRGCLRLVQVPAFAQVMFSLKGQHTDYTAGLRRIFGTQSEACAACKLKLCPHHDQQQIKAVKLPRLRSLAA